MSGKANFRVDPRLATLLGENYRSTEHAIRELVDNSWDADAENVRIMLPEPFTNQPIVVADDGAGMTEAELRREYLLIAHDRRSRGGGKTLLKGRPIRGRKGIGKFAGLVAAEHMKVETRAKGNLSILELEKASLLASKQDLESIDLPFAVAQCRPDEHGTTIILSELNSRFSLPSADTLRELLALEFGRHAGFSITVNGEALTHDDIQGESFAEEVELPNVGPVSIRFTIMENPRGAKHAGVVTRVGGKIVGKPSWFGLEQDEEVPRKVLSRVVGEIEADGLEGDVTADWGALFDNSKAYRAVREWARDLLKKRIAEVCHREVNLAKARKQKQLNELLARLPEHRRPMAERALDKIFRRFYGDAEERIDVLISLTLEAFEKDEYWNVCQKIENADHSDIATLADALQEFGLADLAYMGGQARRRLQFLDELDKLARDGSTLESTMHKALETNLWVFGPEYSLMASNKTLARTIEDFTGAKYTGPNAAKRPDLLLAEDVLDRHLLVEFKRPSHSIGRDDENQAEKYRDELTPRFGTMDILVIGGVKERSIQTQYQKPDIKILTYEAVISRARTQLRWLLKQLSPV